MPVSKRLKKLLREALEEPSTLALMDMPRLRPSALPFCPILGLMNTVKAHKQKMELISFKDEFYTGVGTTVHELWQRHIVNHPVLGSHAWGCWECPACGEKKTNRRRPKLCKCGAPVQWKYVEPELRYRSIPGHCDMLLLDTDDGNVLLDLKTTSLRNATETRHFLPVPKHKHQLRAYAVMIERQHGIKIDKLLLVYHPRDSAEAKNEVVIRVAWNRRIHKETKTDLNGAIDAFSQLRIWWKGHTRVATRASLQPMINSRPCTSRAAYDRYMKDAFFKTKCPLYEKCVNSSRHRELAATILQAVFEELEKPVSLFPEK